MPAPKSPNLSSFVDLLKKSEPIFSSKVRLDDGIFYSLTLNVLNLEPNFPINPLLNNFYYTFVYYLK